MCRDNEGLTLINSARDLLDDDIEVDVVKVEAGGLVHESSPNLIEVDRLARPVSLYNILNISRRLFLFLSI